ncbi:phosphoglycerate mutase-like protein [Melanomma pulvis-pyrius CBS 109.77]|uniref:Phosphoglycerate mutase-like protein n=1 Tax=Melanomma pulvis-pyrius CBS 109.77 TaxID=1314802 RepID=A0A6A6XNQ3_9PLEO|nr:phosphoglycerate mutase-like protein [Melanomma pulvis-pyrius CBS 109.77]
MAPTLLLIRHAQALHNVASDWSLHDPPLSELGEQQCAELQESLKKAQIADEVELIVVSAMRRTLQTAALGLDWLITEKKIEVLPDAGWQENADKPCDTGCPITTMASEFPAFDFSKVDPLYPDKTTNLATNPYAFTRRAILARGQTCLKSLYMRPEKVIAVVSHSGFLRTAVCHRRFFNADWRVFDFDEEAMEESKRKGEGLDGEGEFLLKEWKETEENGGGMGRSEKGIIKVLPTDFPPDEVDGEAVDEVPGHKVAQWEKREKFQAEQLKGCA